MCKLATLILVTLVLIPGCGSSGDSGSSGSGGDTSESSTSTTANESADPAQRFAKTEVTTIPIADLQACPDDYTFSFPVLYKGREAQANCGRGTATIKVGATSFTTGHGWCEIDSDNVSYNFGTTILDSTGDGKSAPQYGPDGFSLSLGAQTKDAKPVAKDGVYVDGPMVKPPYRSNLVIQNDTKLWTADTLYHTTTVTLTHGRTRGAVAATNHDGTKISVTFQCGNRIVGTDAPTS